MKRLEGWVSTVAPSRLSESAALIVTSENEVLLNQEGRFIMTEAHTSYICCALRNLGRCVGLMAQITDICLSRPLPWEYVCVRVRVHMHLPVCLCMSVSACPSCLYLCMSAGYRLMGGEFLNLFPPYFFETGSLTECAVGLAS